MTAEDEKTCFIAMPITTHDHEAERYAGDTDHWSHVLEAIFVPAIKRAGFKPVRPQASGSDMIHGHIVRALEQVDMVLCDLSGHNPNVFFELGVRTSINKPIALVKDEHLGLPFDTGVVNTHMYSSKLHGWEIETQIEQLARHLRASEESCNGSNPMWRHFGLTIAADAPPEPNSSSDAQIALMFEGISTLRDEVRRVSDYVGSTTQPRLLSPDDLLTRFRQFGAEIAKRFGLFFLQAESVGGNDYRIQFASPPDGRVINARESEQIALLAGSYGCGLLDIIPNDPFLNMLFLVKTT